MNDIEAIRKTIRRLESRSIIPFDEDADEVVGIAIQGLEKQIPKEPIYIGIESEACPVCLNCLKSGQRFCENCGQRLEW
ncbi:hypothetical protein [Aminipila sp.]|uniref:hypothetical protein n=1 Tax=Aminipila sp. TaxID=2060095 RepID=UPI002896D8E3|nr:hypothetical protein [Aminipila sp.]